MTDLNTNSGGAVSSFPAQPVGRVGGCQIAADAQPMAMTRSGNDDLRIAKHEAAHLVTSLVYGKPAFATIIPGDTYSGLCWHDENISPSELSDDRNEKFVPVVSKAVRVLMPKDGEKRDNAADIYLGVFTEVVIKMAGTAAEDLLCTDGPPWYAASDHREAKAIAGIVCSSPQAVDAFVAFALEQAKALINQYRGGVEAIAEALVEKRTLNDPAEINALIAAGLNRQQLIEDRARRAAWRQVTERVANVTA